MKLSIGILLIALVAVQGAVIKSADSEVLLSTFLISPESLFDIARDYHERSKLLQTNINEVLTYTRTAVSTVLEETSGGTLGKIEENSKQIMALDNPARNAIFSLEGTLCVNNLKVLLNGITEFTGFESSNCLAAYDTNVQNAAETAFGLIQGFDGNYADVQQIVVRSFIGKNAFVQAEEIEKRFTEEYNKRVGDVGSRQAEVDEYIKALTGAIEYFNNNLDECFKNIHNFIAPAYVTLQEQIKTCEEFDNTPNPFASFLTVTTTPAIGTTPAI